MKKNCFKKIISVILSVFMLTSVLSLAASAVERQKKIDCPEISIHGFMGSTVYMDPNDPDSPDAWPPTADEILGAVKSILPSLAKFSVTWNYNALADALIPVVNDLFRNAELDNNGAPVATASNVRFNPKPDPASLRTGNTISFRYDWRIDPLVSAAQLNDFINYVLESTGAEKVTLTAHSLGGVVMLTYLTKYGYDKVSSVCFNTSAVFGETYTGELLSGQITLNGTALQNYIKYAVGDTEYDYLVSELTDMLKKAGLLDFVSKFGNHLIEKLSARVIPESVVPLFAHWLTIWAMIPDEYVDACEHYVFDNVMKDSGVDYTELRRQIDAYNTEIRPYKKETLNAINNCKSVSLYVISRYGYSSLPLTPSYNNLSDGTIDSARTSFGATTAPFGQTLPDDEIQKGGRYISPDKTVDASTCMFPDQTWFINHYKHSSVDDSLDEMIDTLMYHPGQATIDTFEAYPQFLVYNAADRSITPDQGSTVEKLNFFQRFIKFFKELRKILKMLFESMRNR